MSRFGSPSSGLSTFAGLEAGLLDRLKVEGARVDLLPVPALPLALLLSKTGT